MRFPSVAVVIVNYNGESWLTRCLKSLRRTDYPDFRTILVDNDSRDGSVDMVTTGFPEVEVIRAGGNLGFCEGNNLGIQRALESGAELVALLNPDTWVEPEWLRNLVEVSQYNPEIGIVGAVQLRYDGNDFNSWTKTAFPALLDELRVPEAGRDWIPVEWVEGACLLVKRAVLDEVGWLDPIFFAFYEEIDLCRRVRAHGYGIGLVPRSRIHHFRGGSWESTPELHRERNFRCDRSQFVYELTDPQRRFSANLVAGFRTLATKVRGAVVSRSPSQIIDLLRILIELIRLGGPIGRKWSNDRMSCQSSACKSNEYN
jgi:hypothetical protein